jgi:hypothetical protein
MRFDLGMNDPLRYFAGDNATILGMVIVAAAVLIAVWREA